MSADETHSLADQAAAWVPPWARQPSPSETQPASTGSSAEVDPVAEAPLADESLVEESPVGEFSVEDSLVEPEPHAVEESTGALPDESSLDEPFTADDVPSNGRSDDPLEAQRPDETAGQPTDFALDPDESDMSGGGSQIGATGAEGSETTGGEGSETPGERVELEPLAAAVDQPIGAYTDISDESDMSGAEVAIGTVDAITILEETSPTADEVDETASELVVEHPADLAGADLRAADLVGDQVAEPVVEAAAADLTAAAGTGAAELVGEQTALPIEEQPKVELSDEELRGAVEAILLIVDEPVTEIILAQVLDQPVDRIAGVLDACSREYAEMGRGFELRRIAGGWRLYTRSEYAAYVEKFVLDGQQVRLTQAALETLAVVAYKQPVTRSRISAIRGVNCDGVVRTLVARGLIEECGSEPESGAFLYRTTTLFLEKLGLDSVEQLPPLAPFLPDDVDEIADAQR